MSFKYFRPTLRKVNTTQKAPAFINTSSAERFADQIDAADILTNHSVEKHLAEVNIDDDGHSILKESGLTRGHSILENSFSDQLAGHDSILGGAGKQNESQFGEGALRFAGAFGKGMAGKGSDEPEVVVENSDGTTQTAPADEPITGDTNSGAKTVIGFIKDFVTTLGGGMPVISMIKSYSDAATTTVEKMSDTENVIIRAMQGTTYDPKHPTNNSGRPAPDDNGGGEGGFMTWKLQDQLSNDLNNAKDPITNPNGDDLGSGYLSDADLIQMESDLRNAKDPATNWGDDTYNNFMGAIEMNIGEISLKAPATNWGDDYTSTTANVVDTLFTVQNDF